MSIADAQAATSTSNMRRSAKNQPKAPIIAKNGVT